MLKPLVDDGFRRLWCIQGAYHRYVRADRDLWYDWPPEMLACDVKRET